MAEVRKERERERERETKRRSWRSSTLSLFYSSARGSPYLPVPFFQPLASTEKHGSTLHKTIPKPDATNSLAPFPIFLCKKTKKQKNINATLQENDYIRFLSLYLSLDQTINLLSRTPPGTRRGRLPGKKSAQRRARGARAVSSFGSRRRCRRSVVCRPHFRLRFGSPMTAAAAPPRPASGRGSDS